MIKIEKYNGDKFSCISCKARNDLFTVRIGRNETDIESYFIICPACRKELSKMLLKRAK